MSPRARERLAGLAGFSVLLLVLVGGLAAGFGAIISIAVAVAAAVAVHMAITS